MKTYSELSINQKLQIKLYAMNVCGKRWHSCRPDFISSLNELQINYILSCNV